MIEKYFRTGVRLKWTKPQDVLVAQDGSIVDSTRTKTQMTYDGLDSHLVDPAFMIRPPSSLGLQMRMPIQYSWLDYNHGRTSRIHIGPYDILTGFMSGCWIVHWNERGINYAGHIGTVTEGGEVNRIVKRKFSFAMNKTAKGFNPADAWQLGEITALRDRLSTPRMGYIMAMVSRTGSFYSMVVFKMNADMSEWCIGGIKCCAPTRHDQLKLLLLRT